MSIAHFIDHTILKPETTIAEIEKLCAEAVTYGFASVCVPPYFIELAKEKVAGSSVKVATVIGFPFGYSHYTAKVAEVNDALAKGADELDMVINIAALLRDDLNTLEAEIKAVTGAIGGSGATLKLILESGILTIEQIVTCCQLYRQYPVQFLKTSTGYAAKGASVTAVQTMRANLPEHIQIKASGGIRDYAFAKELIDAGATRLGCSASVAIVNGEPAGTGNY
ncbi:deoxyribose-phosphate aldolase [Cnuella takakiae]|uniref:Deoxyribose-phosphate aldolase n=1 Tax=Cnuella takakiae TaxID=1302690 RepID=A0A1M5AVV6_9BACT|nr:deoxyribose-phosphate aldolase [Cnuella takakiae]OLY93242.1 deoxyribose-phosphate aldolase [Cnuella takakiae]SHF34323.1 deoxyribose-phosphate aldolase [Cnuella takakiae]